MDLSLSNVHPIKFLVNPTALSMPCTVFIKTSCRSFSTILSLNIGESFANALKLMKLMISQTEQMRDFNSFMTEAVII